MPDYRQVAADAARRYGLGDWFVRQIGQESGFNPKARSGAGAEGIAQIVPKYHPDAPRMNDPVGQIDWAARYMAGLVQKYGDPAQALSVYNSGQPDKFRDPKFAKGQTYNYVRTILGAKTPGATALPTATSFPASAPVPSALPSPSRLPDLTQAVLANLGTTDPSKQLQNLTMAVAAPRPPATPATPTTGPVGPVVPAGPGSNALTVPMTGKGGRVTLSAGADRPGMKTQQPVIDFASRVAGVYGQPLTIGTGTQHNEFVKGTRRQSAHWTGRAADIPSSGDDLTRLGQAALIAAGMPRAKALKQTGGLFNIGPYQVIFNTNEGGNHFNHLHVGVRGQ